MHDSRQHRTMIATRRSLLRTGGLGLLLMGAPALARVNAPAGLPARQIGMSHLHTSEQIGLVYAKGPVYLDPALQKLNIFLRDHYTHEVGSMDPALYDILHDIRTKLGVKSSFQIISGYRSPLTNERLRTTRGGGVARRSLHMDGKAIDVRLQGVPLKELREAAVSLARGGVGYYPRDNFVHVDTGAFRTW